MKKLSFAIMGFAIAGLMTMVSCRKANVGNNVPGALQTITFDATTESNNGSKTNIDDDGYVLWQSGDKLSVNGNDDSHKVTLSGGVGTDHGLFSGTIATAETYLVGYPADATNTGSQITFSIPATQTGDADFDGKLPMAAYSTNQSLKFNNMANVLKLDLTGTEDIKQIEVSCTGENLSGTFTVGTDLIPCYITSGTKKITVTKNMTLTSTPQTVYVMLPVFNDPSSTISVRFIGTTGDMKVGPKALNESNKPNRRYKASVEVALVPYPYISGNFTVNQSTGKKVNFAKGNLFWDGSKWVFDQDQWTNHGANHNALLKWGNASSAIGTGYPSGAFFAADLTMSDGTKWTTLSVDEWLNLLGLSGSNPRTNATNLRMRKQIEGVWGLVILPDNTSNPSSVFAGITNGTTLNAAGAVFLPEVGCYSAINWGQNYLNSQTYYWSKTSSSNGAWCLAMENSGSIFQMSDLFNHISACIRVVWNGD